MESLSVADVAEATGLCMATVRKRADGIWKDYCTRDAQNARRFIRMPPTTLRAGKIGGGRRVEPDVTIGAGQPDPRSRGGAGARALVAPEAVAQPAGAIALLGLRGSSTSAARPVSQMDWALHWQARGLVLFPCSKFLGDPLLSHWYAPANAGGTAGATNGEASIIMWWSQWPDADIAAIPFKSKHFVIVALKDEGGYDSLEKIEAELPEPEFEHWSPWGEHHLWFKSIDAVQTSHHRLGRGLHVLGPGTYCYLPNSRAPFLSVDAKEPA